MDHIVIDNLRPYDGRYEMDLGRFTTREYGWIRRLADYHPMTVADALFQKADPELWSVVAVIMLRRAGKITTDDVERLYGRLLDESFTEVIRVEWGDVAEVDDEPDPTGSSNERPDSSGRDSTTSSERSTDDDPSVPSGMPASVTSGSVPTTMRSES